jgi:hypothetical protein
MKKLFLFCLIILPSFLFAQEDTRLVIGVTLYDSRPHMATEIVMPTKIVSAKVTILIVRIMKTDTLVGYTDENGFVAFPDMFPGTYYIKAEKDGYQVSNYYPVAVYETSQYNAQQTFFISLIPSIE